MLLDGRLCHPGLLLQSRHLFPELFCFPIAGREHLSYFVVRMLTLDCITACEHLADGGRRKVQGLCGGRNSQPAPHLVVRELGFPVGI